MSGPIDCDDLLALGSCNVDDHLNADIKKQLSVSLLHHIAQASVNPDAQQAFYAPATTPTASIPSGGFNHPPYPSWSRDETNFIEPNTRRMNPSLARRSSLAGAHYASTLYEEAEMDPTMAMNGNTVENGAGTVMVAGMDVDECWEISDRDKQAQVPVQAHATAIVGGWIPGDRNPTGSLVQTTPISEQPSMNDRRSSQSGWDSPFASANTHVNVNVNVNGYGNCNSNGFGSAPNYSSNNHNINVFLESTTAAPSNSSFANSDPFYLSVAQLAAAADCRRKLEPKTFAVTSPLRFNPNPVQFGSLHPQAHAQTSYQHHPDLWPRRTELDPNLLQYR